MVDEWTPAGEVVERVAALRGALGGPTRPRPGRLVTPNAAGAIRFVDGAPDVEGLAHDSIVDGGYRLDRFHVVDSSACSVRFHHVLTSDRSDLHDHPWDYVTTLVAGCYLEVTESGSELYRAPVTLIRTAESAHRLELPEGPCWSLIVTGPVRRRWGFYTAAGWAPWSWGHDRGESES